MWQAAGSSEGFSANSTFLSTLGWRQILAEAPLDHLK